MQLSSTSTSARLYKWFYDTSRLPSNLCPYFWKQLFMWLAIIPYSILCLPTILIERFKRGPAHESRIVGSIGIYMILFLAFTVGVFAADFYFHFKVGTAWHSFSGVGFFVSAVLLMLATFAVCAVTLDKVIDSEVSNVTSEFIKAKYNKYCPQIEWKEAKK